MGEGRGGGTAVANQGPGALQGPQTPAAAVSDILSNNGGGLSPNQARRLRRAATQLPGGANSGGNQGGLLDRARAALDRFRRMRNR